MMISINKNHSCRYYIFISLIISLAIFVGFSGRVKMHRFSLLHKINTEIGMREKVLDEVHTEEHLTEQLNRMLNLPELNFQKIDPVLVSGDKIEVSNEVQRIIYQFEDKFRKEGLLCNATVFSDITQAIADVRSSKDLNFSDLVDRISVKSQILNWLIDANVNEILECNFIVENDDDYIVEFTTEADVDSFYNLMNSILSSATPFVISKVKIRSESDHKNHTNKSKHSVMPKQVSWGDDVLDINREVGSSPYLLTMQLQLLDI